MAAGMHAGGIRRELNLWAEQHNCCLTHGLSTKNQRPYLIVEFPSEQALTMFALSWRMRTFMGWQIVKD